jgi:hypothetical protein
VLIDVSRCWFNKKGMTIEILNNKNKHFTDLDFILQTLYLFHTNRPPDKREKTFNFNQYDEDCHYNRESYLGPYEIINGIPRNPMGRTGMTGRGLLGRWGPNHAGDPIVTRYVYVLTNIYISPLLRIRGIKLYSCLYLHKLHIWLSLNNLSFP